LITKRENIFSVGELAKSRILEIGFNAGHSASLLLLASQKANASLTIVDIGEHAYMKPCYDRVAAEFPERTRLFIGDSRDKLAELVAKGE
jgi:predicted O-methyltransferase YrrM